MELRGNATTAISLVAENQGENKVKTVINLTN